jgi:hypothetical protein
MNKNPQAVALAKKRWAKKTKKEKAAHMSKMAKARWDKLKDQSN